MSETSLVLGVLGGMGPAATLAFLNQLHAFTPAKADADHIRVLMDLNPKVPDRNTPGSNAGAVLAEMAGALAGAGAEVLAMPCNTAHAHAGLIQRASGLPLIDLIQEEGKTLLFTSHVLTDVERVADRVALIDRGVLRIDAPLDVVQRRVRRYELVFVGVTPLVV